VVTSARDIPDWGSPRVLCLGGGEVDFGRAVVGICCRSLVVDSRQWRTRLTARQRLEHEFAGESGRGVPSQGFLLTA